MKKSKIIRYKFEGNYYTNNELAKKLNLPKTTVWRKLKQGWSPEQLVEESKLKKLKSIYDPNDIMKDNDPCLFEGCSKQQIEEMLKIKEKTNE